MSLNTRTLLLHIGIPLLQRRHHGESRVMLQGSSSSSMEEMASHQLGGRMKDKRQGGACAALYTLLAAYWSQLCMEHAHHSWMM